MSLTDVKQWFSFLPAKISKIVLTAHQGVWCYDSPRLFTYYMFLFSIAYCLTQSFCLENELELFKYPTIHAIAKVHATNTETLTAEMNHIDHFTAVQYFVEKPWILAFTWMPTESRPSAQTPFPDQAHLSMTQAHSDDITPFAQQCILPHHKSCPKMTWETWQKAQGAQLASKCPRSKFDLVTWDVPVKLEVLLSLLYCCIAAPPP